MGVVYRARHTELEKIVALKVLSPRRTQDTEALARFRREMKAVGRLAHPNIIQATDAGAVEGTHFLVTEFISGIDLATLVKQHGPLPIPDACELIRQAAQGLQHAHDNGLVHRDIKPSNLMLSAYGRVKVLDLGLARLQEAGHDQAKGDSTASGIIMGTCDYMAPEQADDPHAVDHRADLYGLGCTLFHLLVGHAPFADTRYKTPLQKIQAHALEPIAPLQSARPDVPAELAAVVDRLLAKNPEERFASADGVAQALRPFAVGSDLGQLLHAAGATSEARHGGTMTNITPTLAAPPRRPPSRVRVLVAVAGLVLGLVLLAVGIIYVQTDTGTLEVTSDDKEVKVTVEQDGKQITILDLMTNEKVVLKSGAYQLKLGEGAGGLKLETDQFVLKRGDKVVVKIRAVATPPAVVKDPKVPPDGKAPVELKPINALEGHTAWVSSVDFSPDGKWIASTGRSDQTLRLWNAKTLKLHKTLKVTEDKITCAAFTHDSKRIAGSSNNIGEGNIYIWDVATGEKLDTIENTKGVWDLAFSSDGKWLAFAGGSKSLSLWDCNEKKIVQRTPFIPQYVRRVAFAPNNLNVVYGGHTLRFWNIADQVVTKSFEFGVTSALRISPNGKLLAAGSWNSNVITLYDLEGKKAPVTWKAHDKNLSDLSFSPNSKLLASSGHDDVARIWDVATQRQLAVLKGHKGGIDPIAFSPDGNILATGGAHDFKILIWDVAAFGG